MFSQLYCIWKRTVREIKSVIECKQTDAKSVCDIQTDWKDLTNVLILRLLMSLEMMIS